MEQNTIGARIAALRKDRGMTQQQLADLLSVSNKAVSRWEREESAPDLSLVPMIADIFGITCDELLRGEAESVRPEPEPAFITPTPKNLRIYTTLSCGLILLGLMAALICYLGLGYRYAVLGFCLELAFCLAAGVCQTIGTLNAPEEFHRKKEAAVNTAILALAASSGSAMMLNSSLDLEEILLLGIPLAALVSALGTALKWTQICPSSDEKLHSLRTNIAGYTTAALIVTATLCFLLFAATDSDACMILVLLLTPIELLIASAAYLTDRKKLSRNS